MKLESIHINRITYGKDQGKLMGEIGLDNQYAKVTLKVSEEQAEKIVALVAGAVVEHAHEVSQVLVNDLRPTLVLEAQHTVKGELTDGKLS